MRGQLLHSAFSLAPTVKKFVGASSWKRLDLNAGEGGWRIRRYGTYKDLSTYVYLGTQVIKVPLKIVKSDATDVL